MIAIRSVSEPPFSSKVLGVPVCHWSLLCALAVNKQPASCKASLKSTKFDSRFENTTEHE